MELKHYEGENVKNCMTDIFDKCNCLETASRGTPQEYSTHCLGDPCHLFHQGILLPVHDEATIVDYKPLDGCRLSGAHHLGQKHVPDTGWCRQMVSNPARIRHSPHDPPCKVGQTHPTMPTSTKQGEKEICYHCGQECHYAHKSMKTREK